MCILFYKWRNDYLTCNIRPRLSLLYAVISDDKADAHKQYIFLYYWFILPSHSNHSFQSCDYLTSQSNSQWICFKAIATILSFKFQSFLDLLSLERLISTLPWSVHHYILSSQSRVLFFRSQIKKNKLVTVQKMWPLPRKIHITATIFAAMKTTHQISHVFTLIFTHQTPICRKIPCPPCVWSKSLLNHTLLIPLQHITPNSSRESPQYSIKLKKAHP